MKRLSIIILLFCCAVGTLIFMITEDHPTLFLPFLFTFTAILGFCSHKYGWFVLDDRQLFRQPLFILSIAYPVFLFLFFGAWAWQGHHVDLSSEGYLLFLNISKFPLIILAASVPLAAIVNNVHRTIQTEKQIDDTGLKNRNDIYYGHLKFILDQLEKIEGKDIKYTYKILDHNKINGETVDTNNNKAYKIESKLSIQRPMDLYRKIFNEASATNNSSFNVSKSFLSKLKDEWQLINDLCRKIIKKPEHINRPYEKYQEDLMRFYSDLNIAHDNLCNFLCLEGFHTNYSFCMQDKAQKWHWTSTFGGGKHIYASLRSLEAVTILVLDKVRDTGVDEQFPSSKPIFEIGSGFVEDLSMHFFTNTISDYQTPSMKPSIFNAN